MEQLSITAIDFGFLRLPRTKSKKLSPLTEPVFSSTAKIPVVVMAAIAEILLLPSVIHSIFPPHGIAINYVILVVMSRLINEDKTVTMVELNFSHV